MSTATSTTERCYAGFTATIVNLETGGTEVTTRSGYRHETGTRRNGGVSQLTTVGITVLLKDFCDELRARPGDWRIRTISTPDSILTDLRGRQPAMGRNDYPEPPERQMLGNIGQLDMLETTVRAGRTAA